MGIHDCNETDEQVFIMLLPVRGNSAVVGVQLCWFLNYPENNIPGIISVSKISSFRRPDGAREDGWGCV